MLQVGTKAPDFTLPDQNGNMHSLKDYRGKKLLLYFYPKDNTSGCTKQAIAYSSLKGDFEKKGITVVGVSKDSVASHKKFEEKQDLTITILSDEERKVIEAMKMETNIVAHHSGKIKSILTEVGSVVESGELVAVLE